MKKLIIFIFFCSLAFAKEKVIVYCDQDYPPYTFLDKTELNGIYIDLLEKINTKLKDFEIILEPMPWTRAVKMLESGQAEVIIDAWYRPKERPYMIYSTSMLGEEIVVVSFEEKGGNWPKDFAGKKIGINRGFAVFTENEKKLINIEEANSTGDNILKLIKGRISYYANDKYSILWELKRLVTSKTISSGDAKKIIVLNSLSKEDGYIGFRKTTTWKNQKKFIDTVNVEIEKMKKNGELAEIIKKYTGE